MTIGKWLTPKRWSQSQHVVDAGHLHERWSQSQSSSGQLRWSQGLTPQELSCATAEPAKMLAIAKMYFILKDRCVGVERESEGCRVKKMDRERLSEWVRIEFGRRSGRVDVRERKI